MTNHLKLADSYLRLSDEEKKYGNESESITNQREIIRDYCKKQGIIIVSEFVDDGYSGGNFERPGFQAMLNHLTNTVITKDLSRLGRDMTESSYYAERFFPEHGIHYLAPGNDFDSMGDNLMAPFRFAMNDVYLRDTSRKVKQTLDMKRKKANTPRVRRMATAKPNALPTSLSRMKTPRLSYSGFLHWRQRDNPAAVLQSSSTRTAFVRR